MGDKTQLIALTLRLRYRRPWIVMLRILVVTIFNMLASAVGAWGAAVPLLILQTLSTIIALCPGCFGQPSPKDFIALDMPHGTGFFETLTG